MLDLPRRISSRVWLLTLPAALVSFERRQNVPKLPIGPYRLSGVPVIAAGVALAIWSWRNPQATIAVTGPAERLARKPATLAGLLVVIGAGLLLRSPVLILYALGIATAAATDTIEVDEPSPDDFAPGSFLPGTFEQ